MVEENMANVKVNADDQENLVKEVTGMDKKFNFKSALFPALIVLIILIAGGFTGYLLAQRGTAAMIAPGEGELIGGAEFIQGTKEMGIKDEKVFRDTAEGKIEVNDDQETEGSHKLIRPGGESQTASLTSSVLDLNQFLGKCVQIWGETFASQKAGWLMDVGRVKILDSCPEGV